MSGYNKVKHIMTNTDYHKIVIQHSNIKIIRLEEVAGCSNFFDIIESLFNMPILRCQNLEIVYIQNIGMAHNLKKSLKNMPKDMSFCVCIDINNFKISIIKRIIL